MPKPLILDPNERRKKKKKRRKRKVDYTELLKAPVITDTQCPHTRKAQDKNSCSICLGAAPTVVHRPPPIDWWGENEPLIEVDLEEIELIATILADDD